MADETKKPELTPQAPAYDAQGLEIPEVDQPRAFTEGRLNYAKGAKVILAQGDRRLRAPAEEVPKLTSQGWRPEMPSETVVRNAATVKRRLSEQYPFLTGALAFSKGAADTFSSLATWDGAAEAAAIKLQQEGYPVAGAVISALTPGGYGRAAEKLSPQYAQTAADAMQYSPKAAIAGKAAGVLGAIVAPNPFGVAGALTRGAAEGTNLAKIAALGSRVDAFKAAGGALRAGTISAAEFGAAGALEGAGYSVGAELEAAVRARQDITAERLLSAGLTGGAIGGAFGGALGGIGGAFKSKFARSLEEGVLNPENYVSRAFGLTKGEEKRLIKDLGPDGYKEFTRRVLQEHENAGILNNANQAEVQRVNDLRKAKAIASGEPYIPLEYKAVPIDPLKGGLPQAHQALSSMKTRASDAMSEAFDTAEKAGLKLNSKKIVDEVNTTLERLSREGGISKSDVRSFREKFVTSGVDPAENARHALNQSFGSPTEKAAANAYFDMLAKREFLPVTDAKTFGDMQRIRYTIDGAGYRAEAGPTGEKIAKVIRTAIESGLESQLAKNPAAFSLYKGAKKEFSLVSTVEKFLETKAAVAQSPLISGRDVFGMGIGAVSGHAVHTALGATGPVGIAAGMATGLAIERARKGAASPEFSAWMARRLNSIRGGTDATALKLASTVNRAVSKNSIGAKADNLPKFAAATAHKFADAHKPLANVLASPQLAQNQMEKIHTEISKKDRGVARATTQKLIDDIEWLQSKLPAPAGTPGAAATVAGLGGKPLPFASSANLAKLGITRMSPMVMNSFINYYRSLNEPLSEIEKFQKSGRLNPAMPEVLRERRPVLLSQIRAEISESMLKMAGQGKIPNHKTRVQMSMLTGDSHDITMTREFTKMSQDVWAEEEAARMGDESAGPTPGTRSGGRQVSEKMRMRAMDRSTASEDLGRRRD